MKESCVNMKKDLAPMGSTNKSNEMEGFNFFSNNLATMLNMFRAEYDPKAAPIDLNATVISDKAGIFKGMVYYADLSTNDSKPET
jgi:hypothetical protein